MRLNPFRRRTPRQRRRHQAPPPPTPAEPTPPTPAADPDLERKRRATRIRRVGYVLLIPLGVLAGAYSYVGVYEWVKPKWGEEFARGFPLLLDGWILIATCFYIAGAMEGKRLPFWRITAHGAVAGTILLNALSVQTPTDVVVHVVGPIIWSLFAEGVAHELLGDWKATHARTEFSRVPLRLWFSGVTSFKRSWRATLRVHRMGYEDYRDAFDDVDYIQAALKLAAARGVKGNALRVVRGFLLDGSLPPREIIPLLKDAPSEGIAAAVSERVLERERIAAETAERSEMDRLERQARIAAEERRITAEREETERLERERLERLERSDRERREREDREREDRERDDDRRDDRRDDHDTDEPGGRHEWTTEQLTWIQKQLDAAWEQDPTPAGMPKGSQIQALAKETRPDLGIHDVNPVTVRGRVNRMWRAKAKAAAGEQGRVVPFRAQG